MYCPRCKADRDVTGHLNASQKGRRYTYVAQYQCSECGLLLQDWAETTFLDYSILADAPIWRKMADS